MKGISMTGCILHGDNKKKNQDLKLKPYTGLKYS